MQWYLKCLKNYGKFAGRARRKEYWMFSLVSTIVSIVLIVIDNIIGLAFTDEIYGPIYAIYVAITCIPTLAVQCRRLHDIDKSGWWMLFSFIPLIGWIGMLIFNVREGDAGENRFGLDPKDDFNLK